MSTGNLPRALIALAYAEAAREYLSNLPLEHFMEATAQATQRKITLASFELVHARRSDVQMFNELLVQYPRRGQRQPVQVVPDNMAIVWPKPIDADGSYDIPLQPARPFWMFEYVSKHSQRKDYEDNFHKYERELKVPYYLVFYPDNQELTLYQLRNRRYRAVPPNDQGRHPIPELEMEVGLLDGWVRYWFRGELLLLPADLLRELDEVRRQLQEEKQRADHEKQRAEKEKQRADQEKQRADRGQQRVRKAAQRTLELEQRLEQEAQARQALERELEMLRARPGQTQNRPSNPS
jgi:Putative restriction endonuclease